MPKLPELPVDVANSDGVQRTASTPSEFWDLHARGYTADRAVENLTPQQKAARTRAANKPKEGDEPSEEQESTSQEEHNKTEVGTNAD